MTASARGSRGPGRVRRRSRTTAFVLTLLAGVAGACGGLAQAEGSPLCDALATPLTGIDTIRWDNGITRQEATWGTVLDAGVLEADEQTREALARAVIDDDDGFRRVLESAPQDLREQLEHLHGVVAAADPAGRDDPETVGAVEALRAAAPPEVCGSVR